MESFTQAQDLKTLLGTQKDLSQLEDIGELRVSMDYSHYVINIKCFVWYSNKTVFHSIVCHTNYFSFSESGCIHSVVIFSTSIRSALNVVIIACAISVLSN